MLFVESIREKNCIVVIVAIAVRLLDLGFEKDISVIVSALRDIQHQTVLLSATLSAGSDSAD